ncbi:hypothetical protein ACJJIF_04845 [Microbulbifer sp. SSSA002]|uniref:hypothetical protein n=1 Tax=Microbulbifer sp. SSSA002 TaxID=3243376 RepID=UPI00403A01CB
MEMKLFLLRLLWITHGPLFRVAEYLGGVIYQVLIIVGIIYTSIIYLFLHCLLFIAGIDLGSLGIEEPYVLIGVWFCVWLFEVYIFRGESQRRLKDGAKKNKKLNQLAEECMSRGYALMWWSLIIVLCISVPVGIISAQ